MDIVYWLKFVFIALFMLTVHELGHFFLAWYRGYEPRLNICFSGSWVTINYITPDNDTDSRLIAQGGFVAELLYGWVIMWAAWSRLILIDHAIFYFALFIVHFSAHPWYRRDSSANDFNYLGQRK